MQFKDTALFKDLSGSDLALLKSCLREKIYQKGEILFHEGECCERVFVVQSGRVKLYRMASNGREQILEVLGSGDTCACNPGSQIWHCATTAEAIAPSTVWYLSRDDYIRMVKNNSTVSHTLNRLFADRLSRFSVLIEEVSLKDVKKRLVKFLLDMAEKKETEHRGNHSLPIPFTREELAQRIGTARETAARQLYQLKRAKLIDIRPHEIVIRDKQGLEKILS